MVQGPIASHSCSISIKDESVAQKSMCGLVLLFHAPRVMSLQSLEQTEVGLSLLWLVVSY